MDINQIRNWVAREYVQASAEVHQFVAWLEGKEAAVRNAHDLLNSAPVQDAARLLLTSGYALSASDGNLKVEKTQ